MFDLSGTIQDLVIRIPVFLLALTKLPRIQNV